MPPLKGKHLKLKATLSPDLKMAYVSVVSQSRRGKRFGDAGADGIFTYEHPDGKVCKLKSYPHRVTELPNDYFDEYGGRVSLLVDGVSKLDRLKNFPIPAEHWPLIKEAVMAYNEKYKEG